jgi:hypothetical protein
MFLPDDQDLRLYRHDGTRYRKVKPNEHGRYAILELDLELGLYKGWVRFWHRGELLALPAELERQVRSAQSLAKQERKRREAAEAEIKKLRAQLEKVERGKRKP